MIESHESLVAALNSYATVFGEEAIYVEQFLKLLDHPRCYFRDHLPGHMTASAWILNESHSKVLMMHHAKLNKWLQPGGHADGDRNLHRVACKEVLEETGLEVKTPLTNNLFDIDIHRIPARSEFPEHDHYDIRFVFEVSDNETLQRNNESTDIAWQELREVDSQLSPDDSSIRRMIIKTASLRGA